MMEMIREAGYGIWPVLAFGISAIVIGSRHAWRPQRSLVPLVIGFGTVTMLAGILGTVTGLQVSVNHVTEIAADERWIFLIGLKESLQNMVGACVLCAIAALATTAGSFREARASELKVVHAR